MRDTRTKYAASKLQWHPQRRQRWPVRPLGKASCFESAHCRQQAEVNPVALRRRSAAEEPDDMSTFNACDPRWLDTSGKLWANSCEAASRKLRRFVSGRAATFLLLGVLTGAAVMTGKDCSDARQVQLHRSMPKDSYAKRLFQRGHVHGIQTVVPTNRSARTNLHTVE